jgi:hypothetical protein
LVGFFPRLTQSADRAGTARDLQPNKTMLPAKILRVRASRRRRALPHVKS